MPSAEYDAFVAVGSHALVGLDFDGTLAPIVEDPENAHIHPEAGAVLAELARAVGTVAVITGRPARQVLALGGLDEVGEEIGRDGHELVVLGQYGNERWTSLERRILSPPPPRGVAGALRELPRLLRDAGVTDAFVEEKGLAVAVHTRRSAQPRRAYEVLLPLLGSLARRHGLSIEPGRLVIELRSAGMDKGRALQALVAQRQARAVAFVGDDLGDLEAFRVVGRLREQGVPGLLVCSGSDEESALRALADEVVDGPDGVMAYLRRLTADVRAG